ncbi:hypothetical protein BH09PAT1_BH09PAT1_4350 [soil metagenome]
MQKKVRKFALIGTSCVGKTTLLDRLASDIPREFNKKVVISPEAARYYFSTVKVRKPFSYSNQSAVQSLAKKLDKKPKKKIQMLFYVTDLSLTLLHMLMLWGVKKMQKNYISV